MLMFAMHFSNYCSLLESISKFSITPTHPATMKAKAKKADAMKAKAMKRPAAGLKATATMKAKAMKRPAAVSMSRPAAAVSMPRPAAAVSQEEPWAKLKMSRDEYMFWACRGVDPSMVDPVSCSFHAVLPVREPP